jgi:hypothetical protein
MTAPLLMHICSKSLYLAGVSKHFWLEMPVDEGVWR